MLQQQAPGYALMTTLRADFAEADRRTREALAAEGFGVVSEIDLAATFKKKLHVDFPPYEILGACIPRLAHQAISMEADVGLLLPCNVVVRATDCADETVVEALDPVAQLTVSENPDLAALATEVRAAMERVIARVRTA